MIVKILKDCDWNLIRILQVPEKKYRNYNNHSNCAKQCQWQENGDEIASSCNEQNKTTCLVVGIGTIRVICHFICLNKNIKKKQNRNVTTLKKLMLKYTGINRINWNRLKPDYSYI